MTPSRTARSPLNRAVPDFFSGLLAAQQRRHERINRLTRRAPHPVERDDLLWLVATPDYERAIPDDQDRVALALAIRDGDDDHVTAIGNWIHTGHDLSLLTLAVRAGVSARDLDDHLHYRRRLHRPTLEARAV